MPDLSSANSASAAIPETYPEASRKLHHLAEAVGTVVRGKKELIERMVIAIAAGGHILLEDLPGLGKTTLGHSFAQALKLSFSRIQFTSDLMPSDVTGVRIFHQEKSQFEFAPGPIFAGLILADEINRATPKTQSSLLEVMERSRVTVDGEVHNVPQPFIVIATQNPVDFEGTFPLPESQMDRFLIRLSVGYPPRQAEREILQLRNNSYDNLHVGQVMDGEELIQIRGLCQEVYMEESVAEYLLDLVAATRDSGRFRQGISTRGMLALRNAARASAVFHGRNFITPDDLKAMVLAVFSHRLALLQGSGSGLEENRRTRDALEEIILEVPNPS